MYLGSFDDELASATLMEAYLEHNGHVNDKNEDGLHHEIYMSDARKVAPEKWKNLFGKGMNTYARNGEIDFKKVDG